MKLLIYIIWITLAFCFSGCGTMQRAVIQPDGSVKFVPIMKCDTFARDLYYNQTDIEFIGLNHFIIHSTTYSTKSVTANVISSTAELFGALSNLSPL